MDHDQIGIALGLALFVSVALLLRKPRRPKHTHFTCHRCRTVTPFDRRTIGAWRSGKDRFFCAACHRTWLATHPGTARPAPMSASRGRNRGCLGLVLLAAGTPPLAWAISNIV